MAKETLSTRVQRLEDSTIRLDNAMAHLAEVQIETKQQMAQLGKDTDQRISRLVSAIGTLITALMRERDGKEAAK